MLSNLFRRRFPLRLLNLESRLAPAAGQLDPLFGAGGLVTTHVPFAAHDLGKATAIDSLGRILVAGSTQHVQGKYDVAVTRYTSTGALDPTFGRDGVMTTSIFGPDDFGYALAIDSQDRVIVAGSTMIGSQTQIGVARFTEAGLLDTGFDQDGVLSIAQGTTSIARGVAVDSMDRVIVAGDTNDGSNSNFFVARLTTAGVLDSNFDGDGRLIIDFGWGEVANAVTVDSMDRIVVVGHVVYNLTSSDIAVVRLTTTGGFDSTFDGDGKQTVDIGPYDSAHSVAIDAMNRVVMAGYTATPAGQASHEFAVVRLTATGSLDSAFDGDGKLAFGFGTALDQANGIALDSMERIVVAGATHNGSNNNFAIARLSSAGAFDNSFDGDGKHVVDFGPNEIAYGVAVDSTDRAIIAGFSQNGPTSDFTLARFTSAGALDATFDSDGKLTHELGVSVASLDSVVVDKLGRTAAAGYAFNGTNYDFAVARFTTTGALDPTFGGTGIVTFAFGTGDDFSSGLGLDSLGRIVVAGFTANGTKSEFAIARLTPAGALDDSFDLDGKQTVNFGNPNDSANDLAIDAMDRVIVAGYTTFGTNTDFAVVRLTTAGALDTSFDGDGKQTIDISSSDIGNAVAVDSLGRIVVAGTSNISFNTHVSAARLTDDGKLDSTFDTDGKLTFLFPGSSTQVNDVAMDSLNRIVLVGSAGPTTQTSDFAIARLTTTGTLDTSFDTDGKQTVDITSSRDIGTNVAIDAQGRIVVAGFTFIGSILDFGVARLTNTGAVDTSFDTDGKQTIDFAGGLDRVGGLALDHLQRVIVTGQRQFGSNYDIALARLQSDPPAKLVSIAANDGAQRSSVTSFKIAFDSKVSFAGSPASAFQLKRQSNDAPVSLAAVVDMAGTSVTLTFTGGAVASNGSLVDGLFTLTILADQFRGYGFDGNGDGLASESPADDYTEVGSPTSPNKLFRLFGDANGDGTVNTPDLFALRLAFGGASTIFDFDGDGQCQAADLFQFRIRFGSMI